MTKPVPAERRERMELVRECHKLTELLHRTYKDWDHRVCENADGTFSCVRYNSRDERLLSMDWDGNVKLSTWQTSHHNGDPYDYKTINLDPGAAKNELTWLRNGLLQACVDAEKKLIEEAKKQKVDDVALANVRARLG